jgi:mannosyl-oligosaccharide glucosidase
MGLITDVNRLQTVINSLSDESQMLGMGGLRGLGLKDSYYGTTSNYWKSPVWINVNFLLLGGLFDFYINGSMKSK